MSLQLTDEVNGQGIRTVPACNQAATAETSLVAAARGGDAAAFEQLVARHEQRLRRVAQKITHNREDAEDAVQSSLLRAFVHLRSFRGDSQFSTWLTRIVTNEALMNLRKDRRQRRCPSTSPGRDRGCFLTVGNGGLWALSGRGFSSTGVTADSDSHDRRAQAEFPYDFSAPVFEAAFDECDSPDRKPACFNGQSPLAPGSTGTAPNSVSLSERPSQKRCG